jgi:hypothetical protein
MDRKQLQQAIMEAQASIQMQAQQQLSERMQSICFKRCITAPTDKLADRQRRCLDQCLGAFMEGFGVAVSDGFAGCVCLYLFFWVLWLLAHAVEGDSSNLHMMCTNPPSALFLFSFCTSGGNFEQHSEEAGV